MQTFSVDVQDFFNHKFHFYSLICYVDRTLIIELIAVNALLLAILYFYCISSTQLIVVFPNLLNLYMVPIIKFQTILDEIPYPFSMNDTSFRFVQPFLVAFLASSYKSFCTIFLDIYVNPLTLAFYFGMSSPSIFVINSVFPTFHTVSS